MPFKVCRGKIFGLLNANRITRPRPRLCTIFGPKGRLRRHSRHNPNFRPKGRIKRPIGPYGIQFWPKGPIKGPKGLTGSSFWPKAKIIGRFSAEIGEIILLEAKYRLPRNEAKTQISGHRPDQSRLCREIDTKRAQELA